MRPTFPQTANSGSNTRTTYLLRNNCFSLDTFSQLSVLMPDTYCGFCYTSVHSSHKNGNETMAYAALWSPSWFVFARRPKFGDLIFHFWAWKAFAHNTHTFVAVCRCHCVYPLSALADAIFSVDIPNLRFVVVDDVAELKILVKHHGLPRTVRNRHFFSLSLN